MVKIDRENKKRQRERKKEGQTDRQTEKNNLFVCEREPRGACTGY